MNRYKQISDIDTALGIYYRYPEIGNKQIKQLFGAIGNATMARYKDAARERQTELGMMTSGLYTVNTRAAYEAWGIDVKDLERRRDKLQKLGLISMCN